MTTRGSIGYTVFAVGAALFLLLLYRWPLVLFQIKPLFSIFFTAFPSFLGMLLGFKFLRLKEASTGSAVLCMICLALTLPFLSSLMLYSVESPNPLESIYAPQLIMIIMTDIPCLVVVFVRQELGTIFHAAR